MSGPEGPGGGPRPRGSGWTLAGLLAVAALLRAIGLDGGLWYDEIVTLVNYVRPPLEEILTTYRWNNDHKLYSVAASLSVDLFGEHPWSLRLPALIFGVASVAALYGLGAFLGSRSEGLMAAALLAFTPHHIAYSQDARGYTALLFWTLVCTLLFLRGRREGSARAWILYGVAAALGAYTQLLMGFVILAHAMTWAALAAAEREEPARERVWLPGTGFLVAGLLTLALYAPLLGDVVGFFTRTSGEATNIASPAWVVREAVERLGAALGPAGLAAGALATVGLASYARRSRVAVALFLLPGVLTVAGILAMDRPAYPRFFFFLVGFAVLFLARGTRVLAGRVVRAVPALRRRGTSPERVAALLVGAMCVAALYQARWQFRLPKQDFAGAIGYVESANDGGAPVAVTGLAAMPVRRFHGKSWTEVTSAGALRALARGDREPWLVYTFPRYIRADSPELMDAIERRCPTVRTFPGTVGDGAIRVSRCRFPSDEEDRDDTS